MGRIGRGDFSNLVVTVGTTVLIKLAVAVGFDSRILVDWLDKSEVWHAINKPKLNRTKVTKGPYRDNHMA